MQVYDDLFKVWLLLETFQQVQEQRVLECMRLQSTSEDEWLQLLVEDPSLVGLVEWQEQLVEEEVEVLESDE